MVLKKLLCVIEVMAILSHVHCITEGYGKDKTCKKCNRQTPTARPEEEDLCHLEHADPCRLEDEKGRRFPGDLCKDLVNLYLNSELYTGGSQRSKCHGAAYHGCVEWPKLRTSLSSPKYDCMVHFTDDIARPRRLSQCVKEDFQRYKARSQVYGAQYKPLELLQGSQGKSGGQYCVGETSGVDQTNQLYKSRGHSQSPPRGRRDRGNFARPSMTTASRGGSFVSSLFGSFRKNGKSRSSSPTRRPLLGNKLKNE